MASDAQAWKQKPSPFGGMVDSVPAGTKEDVDNYLGVTFDNLGYPLTGATYVNLNGTFTIAGVDGGATINGTNLSKGNCVTILVDGITDLDIASTAIQVGTWTAGPCI